MSADESKSERRARIYRDGQAAQTVNEWLGAFLEMEDRAINAAFRKLPPPGTHEQFLYLKACADTVQKLKDRIQAHIRSAQQEAVQEDRERQSGTQTLGSGWLPSNQI